MAVRVICLSFAGFLSHLMKIADTQVSLLLLIVDAPRLSLSSWAGATNIPAGNQMLSA